MEKVEVEILLVEDNEKDIELTLHALRTENLSNQIQVARDGDEALEFLPAHENHAAVGTGSLPKLILLDLKLPKIDGLQVLRRIKSNPATQIIPVVVLTSSKEDEDMVNSYRLGVNSYLQKPVNFEQFRKMIKQLGLYWLVVNQLPSRSALRMEKADVSP
jgi:two-component system, response regulator